MTDGQQEPASTAPVDEAGGWSRPWADSEDDELSNGAAGQPLVIRTGPGPEHCGWDGAIFMRLAWPVGTAVTSFLDARQYVRDPDGVLDPHSHLGAPTDDFAVIERLPEHVRDTGFRQGTRELHLGDDSATYAYVVTRAGVERWVRVRDPGLLCD